MPGAGNWNSRCLVESATRQRKPLGDGDLAEAERALQHGLPLRASSLGVPDELPLAKVILDVLVVEPDQVLGCEHVTASGSNSAARREIANEQEPFDLADRPAAGHRREAVHVGRQVAGLGRPESQRGEVPRGRADATGRFLGGSLMARSARAGRCRPRAPGWCSRVGANRVRVHRALQVLHRRCTRPVDPAPGVDGTNAGSARRLSRYRRAARARRPSQYQRPPGQLVRAAGSAVRCAAHGPVCAVGWAPGDRARPGRRSPNLGLDGHPTIRS